MGIVSACVATSFELISVLNAVGYRGRCISWSLHPWRGRTLAAASKGESKGTPVMQGSNTPGHRPDVHIYLFLVMFVTHVVLMHVVLMHVMLMHVVLI